MFRIITIGLVLILSQFSSGVRVCKTFSEYYDKVFNRGCYDNPYPKFSQVQVLESLGFTAKEYFIKTEDGYILSLIRGYNKISKPYPILIGHGFQQNAFALLGKGNGSLPFLLGQEGYDVWLINFRGSKPSRGHVTLSDKKTKYWQFSYDEMGTFDLPATLNTITKITGKPKSIYIGYSMGTNAGYIFAINRPQEAQEKLVKMISVAPAASLLHVRGIIGPVLFILPLLNHWPFAAHGEAFLPFADGRVGRFCNRTPLKLPFCEVLKGLIAGFNFPQHDTVNLPVYEYFNFDSGSVQTFFHFRQLLKTKKFAAYDYGNELNLKKYGNKSPKPYNFSEINIPVSMFVGKNDFLISVQSGQKIYNGLLPQYRCGFSIVADSKWTHYSPLEAKEARYVLYNPIVKLLKEESVCKQ